MHFSDLPVLGIGLAADVAGIRPNYRRFLSSVNDSIDYLSFGAHYLQKRRIEHYLNDIIQEQRLPIVYHPIDFNVAITEDEGNGIIDGTVDIAKFVNAVWTGQDVAVWCFEDQYLGSFLIPAIFDDLSVKETVQKVRAIALRMPCPFLIENPPVNFSLETMHQLDYIAAVSLQADCGIVLDIGHLVAYQQATGRAPDEMPIERFPFDRVVEVHMAGLQISKVGEETNMIDQHALPVHELCWEFFTRHAKRLVNLKGLTLEQEFCEDELVLEHLRRARKLTRELGMFSHAN
jgi:uncharacterized protein (UPF0276 family)